MSVMKRLSMIFRAKANKALDRAEDPRETLDYSYQRQLEMLQKVRRGVADVATSRKRLELQINQLTAVGQARGPGPPGPGSRPRGPRPRGADPPLGLEQPAERPARAARSSCRREEEKLTLASQRLQAKVDAFRTRKETIKATYTAAEAQTKIGEAFSGISEEMGDVGLAVQRAEDKTAEHAGPRRRHRRAARLGRPRRLRPARARRHPAELDRMSAAPADVDLELAQIKARARRPRRRRPQSRGRRPQQQGTAAARPPATPPRRGRSTRGSSQ